MTYVMEVFSATSGTLLTPRCHHPDMGNRVMHSSAGPLGKALFGDSRLAGIRPAGIRLAGIRLGDAR